MPFVGANVPAMSDAEPKATCPRSPKRRSDAGNLSPFTVVGTGVANHVGRLLAHLADPVGLTTALSAAPVLTHAHRCDGGPIPRIIDVSIGR